MTEGTKPASNRGAESGGTGRGDPLFGRWALAALLLWGFVVLGFAVGGLADVTSLWWLVLVFGVAAPATLVAAFGWSSKRSIGVPDNAERDLLAALRAHSELTPIAAAMITSVTIERAAKTLERLASEGHLETRIHDDTIAYALRETDRRALLGTAPPNVETPGTTPTVPLEEPLSERELTVLGLLAEGKTNREVSAELFVAQGTIKAHVAGIYRKLGVRSRAEAVSRGRDLDLIGRSGASAEDEPRDRI